MMRCVVHTNLPSSTLPESFRSDLSKTLCQRYGLEAENLTVWIREGLRLMRSGTSDPCGYLELFGCEEVFAHEETNRGDTTALLELLSENCGIPLERLFVLMRPQWDTNWGISGGQRLLADA
ncbi:macrophage migration inhibitory factor-like [Diadema setosum]|uniref:macrophage migration inhibitory factor-like n=1 Tax=Diadema setosum TaxID=31175 RepID=UPI003B3ABF71